MKGVIGQDQNPQPKHFVCELYLSIFTVLEFKMRKKFKILFINLFKMKITYPYVTMNNIL